MVRSSFSSSGFAYGFALVLALIAGPASANEATETHTGSDPSAMLATDATSATTAGRVMDSADKVIPLQAGTKAPEVELKSLEGNTVKLADVYSSGPTVLIFYRGGWCPFCNRHLGELQKASKQLSDEGVQIVAISPDKPDFLTETKTQNNLSYRLLSDAPATAIQAFGLAFRLDDATLVKYQGYGINLDDRAGAAHHILPVPAAFVIDRTGVIRFAHWDPDYKKRIEVESLLKAAREDGDGVKR